jgi:hypothetical protein
MSVMLSPVGLLTTGRREPVGDRKIVQSVFQFGGVRCGSALDQDVMDEPGPIGSQDIMGAR